VKAFLYGSDLLHEVLVVPAWLKKQKTAGEMSCVAHGEMRRPGYYFSSFPASDEKIFAQ